MAAKKKSENKPGPWDDIARGAKKVGKVVAAPAELGSKVVKKLVMPPKKTVRKLNMQPLPKKSVPMPAKNTPVAGARGGQPSRNIKPKPRTGKK